VDHGAGYGTVGLTPGGGEGDCSGDWRLLVKCQDDWDKQKFYKEYVEVAFAAKPGAKKRDREVGKKETESLPPFRSPALLGHSFQQFQTQFPFECAR